ncbi:Hypothetical protein NTJ_09963 [Nesidiocoris tenuis]|uniref:Uncharacterized protein n=1 Tax=Nesidiocoris tenuis TaxID=355587 RepID=A0ABN7AY87_9HEMI|nr:Hypothetical protein NTJ_09963 [Nesidiocoris tenuis]
MNYNEAYPPIPAFQPGPQLVSRSPQQIFFADSTLAGVPIAFAATPPNECQPPIAGVPVIPMPLVPVVHPTAPSTTTPVPCTTPASVLPPSTPASLSTPPLPRVFVSDHSAVPDPIIDLESNFDLKPANLTPKVGAVLTGSEILVNPGCVFIDPGPRRSSEPTPHHSFSIDERPNADAAVEEGRRDEARRDDVPYLTTYQSTTPQVNNWLKRLLVVGLCALIGGLAIRICMELWEEAYGDKSR